MKKLSQKGFSAIEGLLIAVLVALVAGVGYYVYNQSQKNDETSQPQSSATVPEQKEEENKVTGAYTIDLSSSKRPSKEEVKYSKFIVTNSGGSGLAYDTSKNQFVYGELNFNGNGGLADSAKKAEKHATASDGTAIYLWERADADSYVDYYAIDLKNGKILEVSYKYTTHPDAVSTQGYYPSLKAVNAQREIDLAAIETFKFTN